MDRFLCEGEKWLPCFTADSYHQIVEVVGESLWLPVEEYAHLLLQLDQHVLDMRAPLLCHFTDAQVCLADGLHHMLTEQVKDTNCNMDRDFPLPQPLELFVKIFNEHFKRKP